MPPEMYTPPRTHNPLQAVADGKYNWNATDGRIPHKAGNPLAKQSEIDNAKLYQEFNCRSFDLSEESQVAEYQQIMNCVYNGWYVIIHRERVWMDGKATPVVWLEWLNRYYNY